MAAAAPASAVSRSAANKALVSLTGPTLREKRPGRRSNDSALGAIVERAQHYLGVSAADKVKRFDPLIEPSRQTQQVCERPTL